MLTSSFYPKIDGYSRMIHDLSVALLKRGHEVHLLTRMIPPAPRQERLDGINIVRVGSMRSKDLHRMQLVPQMIFRIIRYAREKKINIIHAHGSIPALVGFAAKGVLGVPFVVTFHGHQSLWPEFSRWKSDYALKVEERFERFILRKSDIVIAQSETVKDFFLKTYGNWISHKIAVIPNGVDASKFSSDLSAVSSNLVLSVANFSRRKGLDVLVRSVPYVLSNCPNARFLLVGEGPQRSVIMKLAQDLGVLKSVSFVGRVSEQELLSYYGLSTVLVLPSYDEFFGLVLLEAMAMSKPVVATRVVGPLGIVDHGNNGILVEPGNPRQLADAVSFLLLNKDKASRMGQVARETVERRFRIDRIAGAHEELYVQVVSSNFTATPRQNE